jgi:hypothetical protein
VLVDDDVALEKADVYWPALEVREEIPGSDVSELVGPFSNDDDDPARFELLRFALLRLNWLVDDGRATPAFEIAFCTVELKSLIFYT